MTILQLNMIRQGIRNGQALLMGLEVVMILP